MSEGLLDVLNIGAGHINISFDKANEDEVAKARRMINDMLRRGYTLLVETEEGTRKVKRFDPNTDEYIIQEPDKKTKRVPMKKTKATAVGRALRLSGELSNIVEITMPAKRSKTIIAAVDEMSDTLMDSFVTDVNIEHVGVRNIAGVLNQLVREVGNVASGLLVIGQSLNNIAKAIDAHGRRARRSK